MEAADSFVSAFTASLDSLRQLPVNAAAEIEAIATPWTAYAALAERTTLAMIGGDIFMESMQAMRNGAADLKSMLHDRTRGANRIPLPTRLIRTCRNRPASPTTHDGVRSLR